MKRKREQGRVCWKRGCGKVIIAKIDCNVGSTRQCRSKKRKCRLTACLFLRSQSCNHVFCPTHRYPADHQCPSTASSASSSRPSTPTPTTATSAGNRMQGVAAKANASANKFMQSLAPTTTTTTTTKVDPKAKDRFVKEWEQANRIPVGPRRDAALAALRRQHPALAAQQPQAPMPSQAADSASSSSTSKLSAKIPFKTAPTDKRARAEWESTLKSLQNRSAKGILNEAEKVKLAEMMAAKESARRGGKEDCIIA